MYARMHTHACMYVCTYMCTHAHTHMRTRTHMLIYTVHTPDTSHFDRSPLKDVALQNIQHTLVT